MASNLPGTNMMKPGIAGASRCLGKTLISNATPKTPRNGGTDSESSKTVGVFFEQGLEGQSMRC